MMNPGLAAMATLCRGAAIPASLMVWLAASGSAAPIVGGLSPSLITNADAAEMQQPIVLDNTSVGTANGSVTEPSNDTTSALHESEPTPRAVSTDPSELLPPETSAQPPAASRIVDPGSAGARQPVDTTEILDECFVVSACIDRYLWALYQRAPKEDTIKEEERRKVAVRKKRRLVTVTRTFTTLVDEDFSWKDRKAADHAGRQMMDYVVGGVDQSFKLRLFHLLHAAEEAGLSPGITSAFRDDYRQSIAKGLKAANDRSYHGGSFRGGYGHGLAADVVSVNGETRDQRWTSSEALWKWIDANGQTFGIGRPYLDRDPAHVAPIDGKEYADHRLGEKVRHAERASKALHRVAMRNHGVTKHARNARSSKLRTI
jgi:hypothetical protein